MVQSLPRDTEEADLTVDSCLNADDTNEQKVFLVASGFENLLLLCLQWNCSTVEMIRVSVQRIQKFV